MQKDVVVTKCLIRTATAEEAMTEVVFELLDMLEVGHIRADFTEKMCPEGRQLRVTERHVDCGECQTHIPRITLRVVRNSLCPVHREGRPLYRARLHHVQIRSGRLVEWVSHKA